MIQRTAFQHAAKLSLLTLGVATTVLSGCNKKGPAKGEKESLGGFKIAVIVPLTGPNASTGAEMANATELAIEEFNAAGGADGVKAELIKRDDKSDSKEGVIAAKGVAQDDAVMGVVAHLNSGVYLPASTTYHQEGLVAISAAATNPEITAQGFPEIFRICTTDDVQGPLAAKYISEELKAQKVSILHDATQYGEGLAEQVKTTLEGMGVTVTGYASITPGEADYRGPLTDIVRTQKPDVLYFGGLYDEAGKLVRQFRDLGGEAVFMGGDGILGKDTVDVGGKAAEGVIASIPGDRVTPNAKNDTFKVAYEKRFNTPIQNYGPFAYDVANILLEAAKAAKKSGDITRESMLEAVKATKFDGAAGHTEFDEKGDTKARTFTFFKVENGDWVPFKAMSQE